MSEPTAPVPRQSEPRSFYVASIDAMAAMGRDQNSPDALRRVHVRAALAALNEAMTAINDRVVALEKSSAGVSQPEPRTDAQGSAASSGAPPAEDLEVDSQDALGNKLRLRWSEREMLQAALADCDRHGTPRHLDLIAVLERLGRTRASAESAYHSGFADGLLRRGA